MTVGREPVVRSRRVGWSGRRLAAQRPDGRRPADVEMVPDAEGDVQILSDGDQVATLEVE